MKDMILETSPDELDCANNNGELVMLYDSAIRAMLSFGNPSKYAKSLRPIPIRRRLVTCGKLPRLQES